MVDEGIASRVEGLRDIPGPLAKVFKYAHPDTISHAYEIIEQAVNDPAFFKQLIEVMVVGGETLQFPGVKFWTADFPLYVADGNHALLYLARRENNLIFQNFKEFVRQVDASEENDGQIIYPHRQTPVLYGCRKEDAETVIADNGTLEIALSNLRIKKTMFEGVYELSIPTKDFDAYMNPTERKLVEWAYGQDNFVKFMGALRNAGVSYLKIDLLNPEIIIKNKSSYALSAVSSLEGPTFSIAPTPQTHLRLDHLLGYRIRAVPNIPAGVNEKTIIPPTPDELLAVINNHNSLPLAKRKQHGDTMMKEISALYGFKHVE